MAVGNLPIAGQEWPQPDHTARIARFALEAVQAGGSRPLPHLSSFFIRPSPRPEVGFRKFQTKKKMHRGP